MPKPSNEHLKRDALRRAGTLHPHPDHVKDPLFQTGDFFDSQDLLQVKYEMLRRVQIEKVPIRRVAQAFGFSRPSVYQAAAAFKRSGLTGLVKSKPGPRSAHKLGPEVVEFIEGELAKDSSLPVQNLVKLVFRRFGVKVHPRSIERALARKKKKRHR